METNMTEGKPLQLILKFMLPLLAGNIFQQLYNMVDAVIVGKYVGANALAAVGSTGTIMFLVIGIANGMSTGFTVLTSQRYGAGDENGTKLSVSNGILLSAVITLIITVLSLLVMHPLLHLMNTPKDIYQDAYSYISVICIGTVALVYYNLFSSFLRAIGNSRMPLYFLIFSASLNVVLDLIFVIGLRMGVAGAAWATDISQAVSAILCSVYIFRKVDVLKPHKNQWHFHMAYVKKQLAIGVPMALQFGITASGTMIMQSAINVFGSVAVTGFTAASKVQNLLTQGMVSIGQTMAAYSGQNYGKRDLDRIHQGTIAAIKISAVYSIVFAALGILTLPYLMRLFFSADVSIIELLPWARPYYYMCAVCYIPLSMIFIYRNTIQGCGFGFVAMTLGIVELIARFIAAALSMALHSYPLAAGADPFAWVLTGFFAMFLYLYLEKKMRKTNLELQE